PVEREIQGQSGHWFVRRIMPYRASDEKTEGVVITYEDVTERRRTADALSAASVRPNWRTSPRRAFSRRRATICDSHCKRSPSSRACWQSESSVKGLSSWSKASMKLWAP